MAGSTQKLSLEDIFRELKIEIPQDDEFIGYIVSNEDSYGLDLFPYIIEDPDKYRQAEIFYQKYLDGMISGQEFKTHEQKYHRFVKTLWLYNDVYAQIIKDTNVFKISYYAKKNKSKFKRNKKVLQDMMGYWNNDVYRIDTLEILESLLFIGTREIAPILIYFKNCEVFLYLDGCHGIILLNERALFEKIVEIAKMNQLYLLNQSCKFYCRRGER